MYDILKRWHVQLSDGAAIGGAAPAAYGFLSGLAASGLTFPFEVVRRRAMIGVGASNPLTAVRAIVAAEGVAGLYKGYGLNIMKVAPSSAITFLVYEQARALLDAAAAPPPRKPKPSERADAERGAGGERDAKLGLGGVGTNEALTTPASRVTRGPAPRRPGGKGVLVAAR